MPNYFFRDISSIYIYICTCIYTGYGNSTVDFERWDVSEKDHEKLDDVWGVKRRVSIQCRRLENAYN